MSFPLVCLCWDWRGVVNVSLCYTISKPLSLGLTQTRFAKKADASDSASETVKREVAEARGPRRTDACCVSPIDKAFDLFRRLYALGESKRETQRQCDCEQYAGDDIGIFQVLSTVSPHGEIAQSSSARRTLVGRRTHQIGNSSRWWQHNPCVAKTPPGKLSPCDLWETC